MNTHPRCNSRPFTPGCFPRSFFFRRLPIFLVFLLVLSGCIRSISRFDDRGWDDLLRGIDAYRAGRYEDAIPILQDVIETYPGEAILEEAQWFLVNSYLGVREKTLALRELQSFLENYTDSPHEEMARNLLFRLNPLHTKTVAVYIDPGVPEFFENEVKVLKEKGINTIILPVTYSLASRQFVLSGSFLRENGSLLDWVEMAHLSGLRVLAKLPLREIPALSDRRPRWRDLRYEREERSLRPTNKLDIFNEDVSRVLFQLYRRLAKYPVDGIYVGDISYGIDEGWTPHALDRYQDLFLERPVPFRMIGDPAQISDIKETPPSGEQFWHWVGWRSRYINRLLRDLQSEVKSVRPEIQFGIAVPHYILVNPLKGLSETSLDFLELNQSKFDFYLLIPRSRKPVPLSFLDGLLRYELPLERIWLQSELNNTPGFLQVRNSLQGLVVR
ncbi:MAG: family 10 glycosylhydrolase [Nitrospiria bacterium]